MSCEKCFPMYFFEGGDLNIQFLEMCEHEHDTFVDGDQGDMKC